MKRVGQDLVGKVLHHPSAGTWGLAPLGKGLLGVTGDGWQQGEGGA